MAFKFAILAALLAIGNADFVPSTPYDNEHYDPAPLIKKYITPIIVKELSPEELKVIMPKLNARPHYSYSYDIQDTFTGDNKQHHETRNGDVVKGSYSLVEPDGSRRTVHYTADEHGFNAIVNKHPSAIVKPLVTRISPPFFSKTVAPVTYDNYFVPIAHRPTTAAPLTTYSTPTVPSGLYNYAAPSVAKPVQRVNHKTPNYAPSTVKTNPAPVPHLVYGPPVTKPAPPMVNTYLPPAVSKVPAVPSYNYIPQTTVTTPEVPKPVYPNYTVAPVTKGYNTVKYPNHGTAFVPRSNSPAIHKTYYASGRLAQQLPFKTYGPPFNNFPSSNYKKSNYYY